jgi:biopolymer transport protein TolR
MSRKNSTRIRRRLKAEINVVPYIDVMLVLLIIFMVTAPLISQGVKVDLPKASSEAIEGAQKAPLIASIDEQGHFFIEYKDFSVEPLDAQTMLVRVAAVLKENPGTDVYVRGDQHVVYGRVIELMNRLQAAGVPKVGLITAPLEK